jgi:hypothetical protein
MSRRTRKTYRVLVIESTSWEVTLTARNEEAAAQAAEQRVIASDPRNRQVNGIIEAVYVEEVQQ